MIFRRFFLRGCEILKCIVDTLADEFVAAYFVERSKLVNFFNFIDF